jgi:hypothetical protein
LNNKETRTLENSRRHIDNWLNQQFEDFTPNPDAGLWQSIDAALDRKERRSKFIWYWLAAGVLLLVTGVTAIQWNLHKHQQTGATNVAKNNERSLAPTKSHSNPSPLEDVTNESASSPVAVISHKSNSNPSKTPNINADIDGLPQELVSPAFATDLLAQDFIDQWKDDANASTSLSTMPDQLAWSRLPRKSLMPGRWAIEIGADANQTGLMYRAKSDYANYIHKNYFDRMKSGEFALSASRIQGALLYQLTKNHSVKIGLAYAENRTQQKFDFRDSMPATVIQGQSADALGYYPIFGYLGLGPQVKFESQSTYSVLSIPMGYTGHFAWRNNLYLTPEVLISANRLGVSAGAQTLDYQTLLQKSQVQDQFRTWVMGARIAMGVEKRLNYAQAIGLRVNAQSMISPMYVPNAALESRGWSVGLSAHYSWRIQ